MLILSRHRKQTIVIADNIRVTVKGIHGNRVSLAIEAPRDVKVLRGELKDREENDIGGEGGTE